jgi:hypothetical protein
MKTQSETMACRLLKLLKRRYVTPLDALREVQCLSLAQRVSQWRAAGISIDDKWVNLAGGKRVKAYKLASPIKATASIGA